MQNTVLQESIGEKKGFKHKKQGKWFDFFDEEIQALKKRAKSILLKLKSSTTANKVILKRDYSFLKREVKRKLKKKLYEVSRKIWDKIENMDPRDAKNGWRLLMNATKLNKMYVE